MMKLSKELQEKLSAAETDVQACKILADNGVDPEAFEKTLPDSFLDQVNGGYESMGLSIKCPNPNCLNADKDQISRQFFASMFCDSATKFRCCKCNTYFKVSSTGSITTYD